MCDVETGKVVHEDDVDWNTQDQPDAIPEKGLRDATTVTETVVFTPEYFCLDYRAANLTPDKWFARNAGMVTIGDDSTVNLDQEARETAPQKAQDEQAEADKRERRKVLALNKLGDAAMLVPRDFVKKLLARLVDCTSERIGDL